MTPPRDSRAVDAARGSAPASATTPNGLPKAAGSGRSIPEATIARLPIYLRVLTALFEQGVLTCSSQTLAEASGINSSKLRKDLSYLGSYGTRGVGYDVEYLRYQIAREIGAGDDLAVIIVGVGKLGQALANYEGFSSRGFRIAALLDASPERVGTRIGQLRVEPTSRLEDLVAQNRAAIGVIATPGEAAQQVCQRLIAAGVISILNFAPVALTVPTGVAVRKVDLAVELQILAYHEQQRGRLEANDEFAGSGTAAHVSQGLVGLSAAAQTSDPAEAS